VYALILFTAFGVSKMFRTEISMPQFIFALISPLLLVLCFFCGNAVSKCGPFGALEISFMRLIFPKMILQSRFHVTTALLAGCSTLGIYTLISNSAGGFSTCLKLSIVFYALAFGAGYMHWFWIPLISRHSFCSL
jgi:hypothetical protein